MRNQKKCSLFYLKGSLCFLCFYFTCFFFNFSVCLMLFWENKKFMIELCKRFMTVKSLNIRKGRKSHQLLDGTSDNTKYMYSIIMYCMYLTRTKRYRKTFLFFLAAAVVVNEGKEVKVYFFNQFLFLFLLLATSLVVVNFNVM